MSTDQIASPTTLADHPSFSTHYGVKVCTLGEDGDLLALGHHEPRRVIAALNRYCRREIGLSDLYDGVGQRSNVYNSIKRGWAVRLHQCGECKDGACDSCVSIHHGHAWAVRWGDVTEDTPDAFPITLWEV